MAQITIATSIIPRDFSHQRSAVDSWRRLGFKVISLNSAAEAAIIHHEFPDITVRTVHRTAEHLVGKPCVYFDDVCAALADDGTAVCGIVNSDILLSADVLFADYVARSVRDIGILFGSRIDVAIQDERDGEKFIYGFDYFFFRREMLAQYPTSGFCLGVPWWDYWAVLVPLLQGEKCMELVSPVAFHVKHETKWSRDLYLQFGSEFAERYRQMSRDSGDKILEANSVTEEGMTIFSIDVLLEILNSSDKDTYPVRPDGGSLIEVGRRQYLAMRENLLAHHKRCIEAQDQINRLVLARESNRQLQDVYSSLSWRITKPLRWLGDKVRGKIVRTE